MLFTQLLGANILIPTIGLSSRGLVPGKDRWQVVPVVTLKVTVEELMGRKLLLARAIPRLIMGQFVRGFPLTSALKFPRIVG